MSDGPINEQPTTRWSLSRIIAAAILVIIVVVGIVYGIYDLTSSGSHNSNQSVSNGSHLVNPTPPPATTKNKTSTTNTKATNNPAISSNAGSNNATKQTTPASSSTNPTVSSSGKLTNTGPGDVAFIAFIGVFAVSFVLHYNWRKRHISS